MIKAHFHNPQKALKNGIALDILRDNSFNSEYTFLKETVVIKNALFNKLFRDLFSGELMEKFNAKTHWVFVRNPKWGEMMFLKLR